MSKKAIKTIGGLILSLALIISFSGAAFAAAVTVSCSPSNSPANPIYGANGVTGNPSDYLPSGKFVQIIESDDATPGTPDPATGAPAGDTVKATGTLSANGTFSGGASIASNKYVYIRAWDTWNGSGAPTGKYGTSTPANVGSGFTYTYKPASFATTTEMPKRATLNSLSPSSRGQGATNQTITLSGSDFQSGATVDFGSGITVNSVVVNSSTQITANISVASNATVGSRNVTVTNPGAPASNSQTFTVNAGPLATSTNPSSADQGWSGNVTITGTNFHAGSWGSSNVVFSGSGITVNSVTRNSDTQLTVGITIASGAATGSRTITITNPDDAGKLTSGNIFTVTTPGAPSISVNPTSILFSAAQGSNPSPNSRTVTITNSGSAALNSWSAGTISYTGGQTGWITLSKTSGGPIAAGGGTDTFTVTVGNVSGFSAGTYTATIPLNFSQGVSSQNVVVTLTITSAGTTGPTISSITPNNPYVGQTIVISGSGFGASKGSSTVTIGGVTANPTAWSDTSITLAVPSGAANGNVVVTVGGASANSTITLQTGGVVIDDVEGGSVGTWPEPASGLAQSGYYTFGAGIEPDNSSITANGPQAEARLHGAKGMKVKYSYVSDWGGGWGAKLANTLDLSSYDKISFYIKWDGSANALKFSLKDSDGTSVAATISNSTLAALSSGYGQVTVSKSSFAADPDGSDAGNNGTFNWDKVVNYNFVYNTNKTSTNYQYIDSITAGEVNLGTGEGGTVTPTGEVVITSVTPPSGPAGTKMTISGSGFGDTQGSSQLVFENTQTKVNYQVEVISWSANTIEAIVPRLAPEGIYTLKVIRIAITRGTMQAFESNPASFQVTAAMSAAGIATIYPNPFNPLASGTRANGVAANSTTMVFNASGVSNVGVYIYDAAGRLVYHTSASGSEVNWNGRDDQGNLVGDGLYLVRIVNEDSKSLIAKGKVLVIKRAQ